MAPDTSSTLSRRWAELALGVLQKSGALDEDAGPVEAEARLRTVLPDGIPVQALYLDAGQAPHSSLASPSKGRTSRAGDHPVRPAARTSSGQSRHCSY